MKVVAVNLGDLVLAMHIQKTARSGSVATNLATAWPDPSSARRSYFQVDLVAQACA